MKRTLALILIATIFLSKSNAVVSACSQCDVILSNQQLNSSYTFAANKNTCVTGSNTLNGDLVFGNNASICISEGSVLNIGANNFTFNNSSNYVNIDVYGTLNLTQNPTWTGNMNINIHSGGTFNCPNTVTLKGSLMNITNEGTINVGTLQFQKTGSKVVFYNYNYMAVSATLNISNGVVNFWNIGTLAVSQNYNSNSTSTYVNCGTYSGSFNLNNGGKVINTGTFSTNQIDFGGSNSRIENYGNFIFGGSTINLSGGTIYNQGIFKFNSGFISGDGNLIGPSNTAYRGYFVWSSKAVMNSGRIGPNLNFRNSNGASTKSGMFNSPSSLTWNETGNGITWGITEPKTLPANECFSSDGNPETPTPLATTACVGVNLTSLQPTYANLNYEWWTGTATSRVSQITSTSSPAISNYTSTGTVYLWAKNVSTGTYSAEGSPVIVSSCTPSVTSFTKSGTEDVTLTFALANFTSNFLDPNGLSLNSLKILSLPSNGSLKLNGTAITVNQVISSANLSNVTFVPNANWNGTTNFTWNATNGTSYAASNATVTITIAPVNDEPTVSAITKSGSEDTDLTFTAVDFTSKFTDIDGDTLTKIEVVSLPANGTLKLSGNAISAGQEIALGSLGNITFTPNTDWNGTTTLNWNAFDGKSYGTSNATVTITIAQVNDAPTVSAITKSGSEDTDITFSSTDFTSKFFDVDGDALVRIKVVSLPANGTLKLSGSPITAGQEIAFGSLGNITFTPKANWNGTTSFAWNGYDELTFGDIDALVNLIIAPIFDNHVAINDINSTFRNISVTGNVLFNDINPDGVPLKVTSETKSSSAGGSVIINSNGDYIYTPKSGFTGKDVFSYTVCNDASTPLCVQGEVTISVLPNNNSGNNPPVGVNDNYKGVVNTTVTGSVLLNDLVFGSNSITISSAIFDSNGDGTPDTNFNLGTPVSVWGINKSGQAVEAGTLTLNNNGTFTFVPATAFEGLVTFKYTITDSKGKNDFAYVNLYIINGNSTYAVDDVYFTYLNHSISGNLLANDYDPEGDVQTLVTIPLKSPKHGSVVLNPDGSFTYSPNEGYVGTDQFVYEIFDAEYPPSRDSATVYINIAKTSITLTLKAKLQGASVDVNNTSVYTTLMRDDLRSKGLIPLSSPYIGLTNSITDSASVLANKNENSIVDWVYIEVRKANAPATVITSTPGLIQRDGDIVDVDGVSPLMIGGLDTIASGTAYITVRHRNHLGIMTAQPVDITQSVVYDFTTEALYVQSGIKENPSFEFNGVKMLWGGDANCIGQLRFTGSNNGSTSVFANVLNNVGNILKATSYTVKKCYLDFDLNMNGEVKYSAASNDRNLLFSNILMNSKGNTLKAIGYTMFYDNLP